MRLALVLVITLFVVACAGTPDEPPMDNPPMDGPTGTESEMNGPAMNEPEGGGEEMAPTPMERMEDAVESPTPVQGQYWFVRCVDDGHDVGTWYGENRGSRSAAERDAEAHRRSTGHEDVRVMGPYE